MEDQWSEENIRKRRLENLEKARAVKKAKRETASHLPFSVTPILEEEEEAVLVETPKSVIIEKKNEYLYAMGGFIFSVVSGATLAIVTPIVVDIVRNTVLLLCGQTVPPVNNREKSELNNNIDPRDIIFRKM